ncbi:hypothetical protein F5Y04DRAFT_292257 [Hypomontagnella monticulosa]|nr:hypothetical protein F5Y04DRAFT_292257 [Hypomontagnella monticulosa]
MDYSNLPRYQDDAGRQSAIDSSGRIHKRSFLISASFLFALAMFCVISRFIIRIFGRLRIRLDDGLVLLAAAMLAVAFAACLQELDALYVLEALNKKIIVPTADELPLISNVQKWSIIFATFNWTSVYLVKFAFLYFFHTLVQGMPRWIVRFFWMTVCLSVVFWVYTVLNPIIICPHFGNEASKCNTAPNQHARSLVGNILVAIIDIISDSMIVAIPIIILKRSMMPFARKVLLGAMLCLSLIMILIALIRLIGSIVDTRPDGSGTAPAWATYWGIVEGSISLDMTSVIVIRGLFITRLFKEDRDLQGSIIARFGRRLLSTLRLSGSSRSSRRSPPRLADSSENVDSAPPQIPTQGFTRNVFTNLGRFVGSSSSRTNASGHALDTRDTDYILEELDYHNIRKGEAGRPSEGTDHTNP